MIMDHKKKYVKLFFKVIETQDYSIFYEIIHPNYAPAVEDMANTTKLMVTEMEEGREVNGIKGLINRFKHFHSIYGNIKIDIIDVIGENNTVIAYYEMKFNYIGNLLGIKPTGKRIELKSYHNFKFKDGKIFKIHMLMDFYNLIKEVGLEFFEDEETLVAEYLNTLKDNRVFELNKEKEA